MKPRRREVEIFNMSLLDILCGALGAFCFMMLALFPDYVHARRAGIKPKTKTDQAQDDSKKEKWNKARSSASIATVVIRWDTPHDIDLYLQTGNNPPFGPKKISNMTDVNVDTSPQDRKSAGSESRSFAPGDVRIIYRVAATNGATAKATVYGFVSVREGLFTDTGQDTIVLPPVELTTEGEAVATDLPGRLADARQIVFRRVAM